MGDPEDKDGWERPLVLGVRYVVISRKEPMSSYWGGTFTVCEEGGTLRKHMITS